MVPLEHPQILRTIEHLAPWAAPSTPERCGNQPFQGPSPPQCRAELVRASLRPAVAPRWRSDRSPPCTSSSVLDFVHSGSRGTGQVTRRTVLRWRSGCNRIGPRGAAIHG
jgi:hypothetical protein